MWRHRRNLLLAAATGITVLSGWALAYLPMTEARQRGEASTEGVGFGLYQNERCDVLHAGDGFGHEEDDTDEVALI